MNETAWRHIVAHDIKAGTIFEHGERRYKAHEDAAMSVDGHVAFIRCAQYKQSADDMYRRSNVVLNFPFNYLLICTVESNGPEVKYGREIDLGS